jgi:hypothetical protein
MFHFKLLELESELLAKELASQAAALTPECEHLLQFIELEVGVKLADRAPKDWRGWISYRRQKNSLVILRGRSFAQSGIFLKECKAGLDVSYGQDAITEYQRNFDITPPQELDHLLINFRVMEPPHVMVWYGENVAPYQLFFEEEASYQTENQLKEAITEGCIWILTRPKDLTLAQFLQITKDKGK